MTRGGNLCFKVVENLNDKYLESYNSNEDFPLYALLSPTESLYIQPGQISLLETGVMISLKSGWGGEIRSDPQTSQTLGLCVLDSPIKIGYGFKDPLKVLVANFGPHKIKITLGFKIATFQCYKKHSYSLKKENNGLKLSPYNSGPVTFRPKKKN